MYQGTWQNHRCNGRAVNSVDLKAYRAFPLGVSGYHGATYRGILLRRFIALVVISQVERTVRFGNGRRFRVLPVVRHVC